MILTRWWQRAGALALALGAQVVVFGAIARPWYRNWGATTAETQLRLPGDEIIPDPHGQETRAITIFARPDAVWPWVAQIGQDRAGFYSYQLLEDLVGCRMPDIQRLEPTLQSWQVGDRLWMYPPDRAGGMGFAELAVFVPGRALGFATRQPGTPLTKPADGSWSFVVLPLGADSSRLIVRGRAAAARGLFTPIFGLAVFEPAHFVMERRSLEAIRGLATGEPYSQRRNSVHVVLWTLTFSAFVAAAILFLRGRSPVRRLLVFTAAGLSFQLLTFVQPSLWLGVGIVIFLFGVLLSRGRTIDGADR